MAGLGRRLNRSETADFFGVDLKTVDAWRRGGCPCSPEGRNVFFHAGEVVGWLRDRAVEKATAGAGAATIEDSNRRRAAAEAGLAELKLARELKTVVAVADVAGIVADEYATVRGRLLSVHGHFEQRLAHLVTPEVLAQVSALVREEVAEALEELAADAGSIAERIDDDE